MAKVVKIFLFVLFLMLAAFMILNVLYAISGRLPAGIEVMVTVVAVVGLGVIFWRRFSNRSSLRP